MAQGTRIPVELKALRQHRARSLAQCAAVLGITVEGYRLKESGKSPITGQELAALADMYGMALSEAFPSYEPTESERRLARHISEAA
jgi:transcriptional regulator with XRE-family HTH domain